MYSFKKAYPSIISQFLRTLLHGFTINIYFVSRAQGEKNYCYKIRTHTKNSYSFH